MADILATLEDVQANLPSDVAIATEDNIALLQISIARMVRGYLSRVIDTPTLLSWVSPETTPEIIKEAAAKLIAAQHYFNNTANQSTTIETNSFAQKRYDEGMALLNGVIEGTILLTDVIITPVEGMSTLEFFPIDATDRSFTKSMNL